MKIFMTGATGFIGAHVLRNFLNAGFEVKALRRSAFGSKDEEPNLTWTVGNLNQIVASDLEGYDVLVHLASTGVSPQEATWSDLMRCNVVDTVELITKAHEAGVRRTILAGSSAEYGIAADKYSRIPADGILQPASAYAASKAAAYMLSLAYAVEKKTEFCYLRIFSAYGEGQFKGNFWPALKAAAEAGEDFSMTAGDQQRDYISVAEVADVFRNVVLRTDIAAGEPFIQNIGTGSPISMREFAEKWWGLWGATGRLLVGELPYRDNEAMNIVPDITPITLKFTK